jgi:hypothetical protein
MIRTRILAASAIVLLLAGCTPEPVPEPVESPTVTAPVETPAPEVTPEVEGFSDDDLLNISESISSGNTAALEQYLAPSVLVTVAASEFSETRTPVEAIGDLAYLDSATGWTFPIDEATIEGYRGGDYAAFIPDDAYGGLASSGQVIIFGFEGASIVSIFISADEDLL